MIGGVEDPALRRVVRHGTGWLAVSLGEQRLVERIARLRQIASDQGRDMASIALSFKIFVSIGVAKRNRDDEREPGTGTPTEIIGDLKRIRDLGFGEIVVRSRGATLAETREQIERFVGEIVPKV
jgi:alkanesulfonate monooxygenase SsuD/methylene tetrahydromethanopterin reductase-like flavin-dependent oxidoreductase (luciferase family)